jgi:hypothetical protein
MKKRVCNNTVVSTARSHLHDLISGLGSATGIICLFYNKLPDNYFFFYFLVLVIIIISQLSKEQITRYSETSIHVCTNRTTGHLQQKEDLIYLTDYLYTVNLGYNGSQGES